MKKSIFSGWRDVFAFTFRECANHKYKRATVLIAIVMLLAGVAIPVIMGFSQKDKATKISPVQTVHVINESSLSEIATEQFAVMNPEGFPDVEFALETDAAEATVARLSEKPNDLVLVISDTEDGILLKGIIPEASELSEDDAYDFLNSFVNVAEVSKMVSSGISMDKLVLVMSGSMIETVEAGATQKSEGEEVVAMIMPMLVSFFLFFIILIYGLQMGNAVSVEKTSKLMEMILTMTRPYGLVLGKILAMVAAALIQVFVLLGSIVVGFFLGDYVAKNYIYEDFNNVILEVFKVLKESGVGDAFSVPAIVLFGLTIIVSILFFSLLAATFGSMASKTEEVAQYMSYFQLLTMLGFFAGYLLPLNGNQTLMQVCRFIPVTSGFMLPADILIGNVTILEGCLFLLLLCAFTVGLVFLVGKVYKNQLFFRGEGALKNYLKKKNKTVTE